jgi:hypothetical protein
LGYNARQVPRLASRGHAAVAGTGARGGADAKEVNIPFHAGLPMTNRRSRWIALASLALAAGLLIAYCAYDSCPIRYSNVAKITAGMTRAQVEELMGCPPGDYSTGPLEHPILNENGDVVRWNDFQFLGAEWEAWDGNAPSDAPGIGRFWLCTWRGDRGQISVCFHPDTMRVVETDSSYGVARRIPHPYWQRVEKFLGWR